VFIDYILPGRHLREFIRLYRVIDFFFPDVDQIPFKAYTPRPEHCLQFYPRDPETVRYTGSETSTSTRVSLVGQHTIVNQRYVGKNFLTFQVVFQPGALFRLTNITSDELTNVYMDAETVFGKQINLINEQLFHAKSYDDMVQIVEQFLYNQVTRIRKEKGYDRVTDICRLMLHNTDHSLDWYIKEACLCHRQFDRRFKQLTGVAPKQFLRITRFDKAYRMKNQFPQKDWATIAIHSGYYDYQHLSKDYKEFTMATPAEFFENDQAAPERVFGEVEI
jgi:AraC-like DNA-binding protein